MDCRSTLCPDLQRSAAVGAIDTKRSLIGRKTVGSRAVDALGNGRLVIGRILAAAGALGAGAILLEYLSSRSLGVDLLLFRRSVEQATDMVPWPGRTSPQTAVRDGPSFCGAFWLFI
jgi:hypothetical protein